MSSLGALPPRRRGVVLALLNVLALMAPALALARSGATDRTREVGKAVQGGRARNVLLFIGDGMGDSEITVAPTTPSAPPAA